MRILATSSNEGNSACGASSSPSFLFGVFQSVLSGISAGICFHILQERKNGRYRNDVLTVLINNHQLKLVNSLVTKWWGQTSERMGRIPRWFWLSAPSYVAVYCTEVYWSNEFLNGALFCWGNMLFWGRYCRNQGYSGGDGDASPESRELSTKGKPRRIDPPLTVGE